MAALAGMGGAAALGAAQALAKWALSALARRLFRRVRARRLGGGDAPAAAASLRVLRWIGVDVLVVSRLRVAEDGEVVVEDRYSD